MIDDHRFAEAKPPPPPNRMALTCVVAVRLSPSDADRVAKAAADARQTISAFGRRALVVAAGDTGAGVAP